MRHHEILTHYIDGTFVESHGREVMDVIRPTDGRVIARVTLADEEDTRRAVAAAKRTFVTYGRSTKDDRAKILRRLHEAASARLDDLTAAMVEEYGGVVQFAGLIVQSGVNAFLAAEKALQEMEWTRSWDKTTVTLEPVGVAGLITAWNANALFICLKLASAVAAGCTVVIKPSELSSLQTRVLVEALHNPPQIARESYRENHIDPRVFTHGRLHPVKPRPPCRSGDQKSAGRSRT